MFTFILLLFPSFIHSKFVGVDVTSNAVTTEYGCMPSQFSASTPSSDSDILVDCSDGCQDLNFPTTLTGYTALIRLVVGDSSTCSVSSRVARAKQKGATAVVLANHLEGEVPYPLSWEYTELLPTVPDRTSSSNGINMAVCLLSYTDAQAILQPVFEDSRRRLPSSDRNTYTQTIEWTKFERWDRANEPSTGQHTGKYSKRRNVAVMIVGIFFY